MGSRRDRVLVAALVGIVLLLSFVAGSRGTAAGGDPRVSTFLEGQRGARALQLLLEELDVPTRQRLTPFADADSLAGPLALLAPSVYISPAELRELAAWVRRGGTLLYAARQGDPTLDTLGLDVETLAPDSIPRFEARTLWPGRAATARPHPWTEGVAVVEGFRWGFAADSSPALRAGRATELLVSGGRPVAVTFPLGRGRVVAWADPLPLVNERLRTSGAALLFARAARAAGAGRARPLWFDEYHHGYRGGGSVVRATLRFLQGNGWGRAALQLFAAGLGMLVLLGRRFGAPLPPPPARRRSPLEHVEALAGAYRQAGARRTVRHLLLAGLARRLGRRLPPRAGGEAELLEALTRHLPVGQDAARGLRDEWKKGDAADLVALTRGVDRLLEEVRRP